METIFDERNGSRRILTEGSFVYFFEDEKHSFTNKPHQGFIEKFNGHDEVNIRTITGKVFNGVSLHRVYL